MAGPDYDKAERVWEWPLREALAALREAAVGRAETAYRFECLLYSITGTDGKGRKRPPRRPAVLEEAERRGGA